MTKTGCYLCAAIYACEGLILLVTTELKCFFNNRSEILLFIDMNSTREGNHFCCEHSVDVAAERSSCLPVHATFVHNAETLERLA